MRLVRPRIPLAVKCQVAARQLQERYSLSVVLAACMIKPRRNQLEFILAALFGAEKAELDHEPALCLREIIDAEAGIYKPSATDPAYLIYRSKSDHIVKTRIRGDFGAFSDHAKIRREKRRLKQLKSEITERQDGSVTQERGRSRRNKLGTSEARPGQPAEAGQSRSASAWPSRPLRSANRWPPKGSRPLRGRSP